MKPILAAVSYGAILFSHAQINEVTPCFVPTRSINATSAICRACKASDRQGPFCTVAGAWIDCNETLEGCCDTLEMRQQAYQSIKECVADARAAELEESEKDGSEQRAEEIGAEPEAILDSGVFIPKSRASNKPQSEIPELQYDTCKKAISIVKEHKNDHCMNVCEKIIDAGISDPSLDASFTKVCAIGGYKITSVQQRVFPDGKELSDLSVISTSPCFSQYIYGYGITDASGATKGASHSPKKSHPKGHQKSAERAEGKDTAAPSFLNDDNMVAKTDTPALCQLLCQNDNCDGWIWEPSRQLCGFVNRNNALSALARTIPGQNGLFHDPCHPSVVKLCEDTRECLFCENVQRCAWKSNWHLSGPTYCDAIYDPCTLEATTQKITHNAPARPSSLKRLRSVSLRDNPEFNQNVLKAQCQGGPPPGQRCCEESCVHPCCLVCTCEGNLVELRIPHHNRKVDIDLEY